MTRKMDSSIDNWMRKGIIVATAVCLLMSYFAAAINGNDPWMKLYAAHHDPALITVTGLDYDFFHEVIGTIQALFSLFYSDRQVQPRSDYLGGQKQSVDAATCLALALTYTHTRGSLFMLQGFFSLTATPLVMWMQYERWINIKILQNLDDIHIEMPTNNQLFKYASMIERAYPVLSEHYTVCHGLKLLIKKSSISKFQGT
jgi:hypothetical protein